MTAGFLDTMVQGFIAALLLGFATLHPVAFTILGIFGTIALFGALLPLVMSHNIGEALAVLVGMLFYLAFMVFLAQHLQDWATAFFVQFTRWGAAVSGGAFTADDFLHPSSIMDMGFVVVRPILETIQRFGLLSGMLNFGTVVLYVVALLVILLAFAWAVKDIIMAILEFYFALLAAPVLIPWGVLTYTKVFFDLGVSWIFAVCVRMFLTTAVLGIGLPLFRDMTLTLTPGGDPTLYSAGMMAVGSVIFAVLIHQVAQRSAGIAGRGMALSIPGSALVPRGMVGYGMAAMSAGWSVAAGAAIRGVSRMIQARRGGGNTP